MSRPFRTDKLPDHPCGYCGQTRWGAVEFFNDSNMPHYKAGCITCQTTTVAHPEDTTAVFPGMEPPDAGMTWPLQKDFALRLRPFMSVERVRDAVTVRQCCSFEGCMEDGTEKHHVAFVCVFGQTIADRYGTLPYCVKHHTYLHDKFRQHVRDRKEL